MFLRFHFLSGTLGRYIKRKGGFMGVYVVDFNIAIHCSTDVEAESLKEAIINFSEKSEASVLESFFNEEFQVTGFDVNKIS